MTQLPESPLWKHGSYMRRQKVGINAGKNLYFYIHFISWQYYISEMWHHIVWYKDYKHFRGSTFWDVLPCHLVEVYQCYRGMSPVFNQMTQHHILVDNILHSCCHVNFKSTIIYFVKYMRSTLASMARNKQIWWCLQTFKPCFMELHHCIQIS
jgi:hypothetical protein